MKIAHKI